MLHGGCESCMTVRISNYNQGMPISFRARYDRWYIVTLCILATVIAGPLLPESWLNGHIPLTNYGFAILPSVMLLAGSWPHSSELHADGLLIRKGLRKIWLRYNSLTEVYQFTEISLPVGIFSSQRLLIMTVVGDEHVITVVDEERFLEKLQSRSPQLRRYSRKLGISFSPPAGG